MKLVIIALLTSFRIYSAPVTNDDWKFAAQRTGEGGMKILGGWALLNLAGSGIGWATSSGATQSFHRMNVYWNVVNLAIAGGAYYSLRAKHPENFTTQEAIDDFRAMERFLWLNIGLDVAYVVAGFYLREVGSRRRLEGDGEGADKYLGYGASLLLQGGFLFAFDVGFSWVLANQWPQIAQHVALGPQGLRLTLDF